jgi:hypothetical protein
MIIGLTTVDDLRGVSPACVAIMPAGTGLVLTAVGGLVGEALLIT